eukprot:m.182941 g.182941  ORF g.182941 m.182941 type:complete len:67 (-) comp14681_c1_seq2:1969-2169(-)
MLRCVRNQSALQPSRFRAALALSSINVVSYTCGALRSFVVAFLRAPLEKEEMEPSNAPRPSPLSDD